MGTRATRIARGAGWVYSYRWIERLLGFAAITVLARLLDQEDFGLVAVAASVVAIVEGLSEFDVKSALIQSRDEDRGLFDSAWTLSALRGLLASLVMLGAAELVADQRVAAILLVLAAVPLIDGLGNPRFFLYERDLVYSRLAAQTVAASLVSFGVTLGVALATRSYWALVLGIVAASAVRTVASYVLRPYRPRATLARWRDIFRFSGWMTLAAVVSTLSTRTDRIIVAGFLGFADTGSYSMTQRIGVLPTRELVSPLQRILFSSFSEMAGQRAQLREAVRQSINVLGSLALAAAVGFALLANDFVPLALGRRWSSIAPLLVVLVPFLGLRATLSSARSAVLALGLTGLMFRVSLVYAMVHLPAFLMGTALFGLEGAIWSLVGAGLVYVWLTVWLLEESVGLGAAAVLAQLRRPLLAAAAMVAVVLLLDRALPLELFSERGSWASLLCKLGAGGLVYAGTLYGLWRAERRPAGIERRLFDELARRRANRSGGSR